LDNTNILIPYVIFKIYVQKISPVYYMPAVHICVKYFLHYIY